MIKKVNSLTIFGIGDHRPVSRRAGIDSESLGILVVAIGVYVMDVKRISGDELLEPQAGLIIDVGFFTDSEIFGKFETDLAGIGFLTAGFKRITCREPPIESLWVKRQGRTIRRSQIRYSCSSLSR